jgi:hypothetical protein
MITLFLSCCLLFCKAQNSISKDTIYKEGSSYYIGNKEASLGKVKQLLKTNVVSSKVYNGYHKKANQSFLLNGVSILCSLGSIATINSNKSLAWGLFLGAGLTQIIRVPIALKSKKELAKSIQAYNKSLI